MMEDAMRVTSSAKLTDDRVPTRDYNATRFPRSEDRRFRLYEDLQMDLNDPFNL